MEVTAINLARVLFFFPGGHEISTGRISIHEARKLLVDRYGFLKSPQTIDEWNPADGAIFSFGHHNGIIIMRFVIYPRGFAVETQTNTDDCEKVIQDLLTLAATTLGFVLSRPTLARKIFLSQITFLTEISLDWLHPALKMLAERVNPFARPLVDEKTYEATGLILNVDESNLKIPAGAFTIERRVGVPFSQNTYFSSAPMPTKEHQKALEDFEATIMAERRRSGR